MSNHEKSNTFTLYKDEIEHARKLLDKNASVNTSRTTAERYANTGINALPHVSDPIFHVADTRHHRNSAKAGKQLDHLLKSKYKQTETPITSNIAPLEEYRNSPEERINSKNIDPKFRERNVLIPQKQKRSRSVTSGANHNMYINKNKNESLPSDQPTMVPVPCPCPSSDHTEKCKKKIITNVNRVIKLVNRLNANVNLSANIVISGTDIGLLWVGRELNLQVWNMRLITSHLMVY